MFTNRKIFLGTVSAIVILLFLFINTRAQHDRYDHLSVVPPFDTVKSGELTLNIENTNFFRNNEYSTPLLEGYTLIGLWGRFLLDYYPAGNIRIRAGGHFLKYHGRDKFSDIQSYPYYAIYYEPLNNFSIVLGNYDAGKNFRFTEVLYEPEYFYTRKPPAGLNIQYTNNRFLFRTFINWETFIFTGDPFQEVFTHGARLETSIVQNDNLKLTVPLNFIDHHHGGQIDSSENKVETLMNGSAGIDFSVKNGQWRYGLNVHYMGYREATTSFLRAYRAGHGALARIVAGYKHFTLTAGYWYGDRFIAPKGRQIYQSVPMKESGKLYPERQLLEGRLALTLPVKKGISFALETDTFYDINESEFSYCWGIHLFFTEGFFLKNFKKR